MWFGRGEKVMATKVFVNHPGGLTDERLAQLKKQVSDNLGILPEDVIVMPGVTLSIVEIPTAMIHAREKADKEAEKAAADKVAAEEKAAKEAEKKAAHK